MGDRRVRLLINLTQKDEKVSYIHMTLIHKEVFSPHKFSYGFDQASVAGRLHTYKVREGLQLINSSLQPTTKNAKHFDPDISNIFLKRVFDFTVIWQYKIKLLV